MYLTAAAALTAADPGCPRYPSALRSEYADSLALETEFETFARKRASTRNAAAARAATAAKSNFIDQRLFSRMAADNVKPAPMTSDSEFLRRVTIDLTGRIPTPEAAEEFLKSTDTDKRAKLIDSLLNSEAYADQMGLFFLNKFRVSRNHESISVPARNVFA